MVIWTERALENLRAIFEYIALESKLYAKRVSLDVHKQAKIIDRYPFQGRKIPELDREDIREVFVYSYRVIYKIRSDKKILIMRILHMSRAEKPLP